jgi:hypothetical protein
MLTKVDGFNRLEFEARLLALPQDNSQHRKPSLETAKEILG